MENTGNPLRRERAQKYREKKSRNGWYMRLFMGFFVLLFFALHLESKLYTFLGGWTQCANWKLISYIGGLVLGGWLIVSAINYLLSYRLEREFKLSTQEFGAWLKDQCKVLGLTLVFAIFAAKIVFELLRAFPGTWWVYLGIIIFLFQLLVTFLLPVVFLPMFVKLHPYPNNTLRQRLEALFTRAGVKVADIYEIRLSERMTKVNAAVMGFGSTRKIVLSDTLRERYKDEEVEGIMAHEIGHHVHHDITKLTLIGLGLMIVTMLVIAVLWPVLVSWRGYQNLYAPEGLPLLAIVSGLCSWLLSPIQNWLSRQMEWQADNYALDLIDNPKDLANAFTKLADDNLSIMNYDLYTLLFLADHPAIGQRIQNASQWKKK